MNWFQRFTHNVMGWHSSYYAVGFDGASIRAQCGVCGFVGLVDSQGNLF